MSGRHLKLQLIDRRRVNSPISVCLAMTTTHDDEPHFHKYTVHRATYQEKVGAFKQKFVIVSGNTNWNCYDKDCDCKCLQ